MADWKKLAKALVLADGVIEERETEIIKRELLADRKIDREEAEFLLELRAEARRAHDKFHAFVFQVVKKVLLEDGALTAREARWLEQFILTDGRVDERERQLLRELKAESLSTGDEFDALYRKYVR